MIPLNAQRPERRLRCLHRIARHAMAALLLLLSLLATAPRLAAANTNGAMIFAPKEWWWDPSFIWHDGQYYLFSMLKPQGSSIENSVMLATSKDGVHWEERGAVITSTRPAPQVFKMFVTRCGDHFIMNHGALGGPNKPNDTLCFYESRDLVHWTYIGENHPDPRYYVTTERWDHMYMLPKDEQNPAAGFWGYPVARPNQAMIDEGRGFSLMESADARHWTPLPPPKVDCGKMEPINFLELCGCEKIGAKYYLIGGFVNIQGQSGYSMFTFVADKPTGPFVLDQDAWRLCGSSGAPGRWGVQFGASLCRGNNELLISQYINFEQGTWLVPVKKAVVNQAGHLQMGYWKNNEAAKGPEVALTPAGCHQEYPAPAAIQTTTTTAPASVTSTTNSLKLTPAHPAAENCRDLQIMAMCDTTYDPKQGAILEGTLRSDPVGRWRPECAGFYIEEAKGKGTAIMLQAGHPSWRTSKIGTLTLAPNWSFDAVDETGPGCATATGLDKSRTHTFRLWLRNNTFELYIDDVLMQTFVTTGMTGRLGFIAQNAPATFGNLKMWKMNL